MEQKRHDEILKSFVEYELVLIAGTDIKQSGSIQLKGKDADITVNDKSLMKTLEAIEERLAMLTPNPEMEKEWAELKEIGDAYRKLEAECVEKSRMWKTLKKTA